MDSTGVDGTAATLAVRCIHGPVRLGARFRLMRDPAASIDLTLTGIVFYGRSVDELDAGHTALVTLQGTDAQLLDQPAPHRPSIRGTQPRR